MEIVKMAVIKNMHNVKLPDDLAAIYNSQNQDIWDENEHQAFYDFFDSLTCKEVIRKATFDTDFYKASSVELCKYSFVKALPVTSDLKARELTWTGFAFQGDSFVQLNVPLGEDEVCYVSEEDDGTYLHILKLRNGKIPVNVDSVYIV